MSKQFVYLLHDKVTSQKQNNNFGTKKTIPCRPYAINTYNCEPRAIFRQYSHIQCPGYGRVFCGRT